MDSYNQNEVPDELQLEQWYFGKQIIAYIMENPTISVISINNCLYNNELENYKVIAVYDWYTHYVNPQMTLTSHFRRNKAYIIS
jgi:hypothetical protein